MELTQTNGFGVGLFWRNVILERIMITRSYEQKVHLDGRGERISYYAPQRTYFQNYFLSYQQFTKQL